MTEPQVGFEGASALPAVGLAAACLSGFAGYTAGILFERRRSTPPALAVRGSEGGHHRSLV
jgi:hypothetical protein